MRLAGFQPPGDPELVGDPRPRATADQVYERRRESTAFSGRSRPWASGRSETTQSRPPSRPTSARRRRSPTTHTIAAPITHPTISAVTTTNARSGGRQIRSPIAAQRKHGQRPADGANKRHPPAQHKSPHEPPIDRDHQSLKATSTDNRCANARRQSSGPDASTGYQQWSDRAGGPRPGTSLVIRSVSERR